MLCILVIGCCEKMELIERVVRLYTEYHKNIQMAEDIEMHDQKTAGLSCVCW